jgi:hypothetical protein
MKRYLRVLSLFVLVVLVVCSFPAAAQNEQPPEAMPPERLPLMAPQQAANGAIQTPEGLWMMPADARPAATDSATPESTGGPDDFGYSWNDGVALNWIPFAGGTDTWIDDDTDHAGPIDIGFSFKYYENTYPQLFISRYGFLAFSESSISRSQSAIPSPRQPNNVIAPHWVPAYHVNGYVRYLRGGVAPNRWFLVGWNRLLSDDDAPEEYTFEAILYESGDILFQYREMNVSGGYWCQASGIEDSTGLDGLAITNFCQTVRPNHAVRISRPAPRARVKIFPQYQGSLTRAAENVSFQIPIRNTGDLGADTFDLVPTSGWPMTLYAADGATRLTDTDHDGTIDTGSVPQGSTATIVAKVQTPVAALVAYGNQATIRAISSRDSAQSKVSYLRTAVPTAFAQVFTDGADGATSLYLVRPQTQTVTKVTPDNYYGYDNAVAETPNGNLVYAWDKGRCLTNCMSEIEFTIRDGHGNPVRGITKLTDHSAATFNTYDYPPVMAVAPDGRIGILWRRYLYNRSTFKRNYNIYLAILDSSGNVVLNPTRVTNNTTWGTGSDLNFPYFGQPRISATGNNRFFLAWYREHQESNGWIDDIYYSVRDSAGNVVRPISRFTNDTPGWDDSYYSPTLARLWNNRTLMAFTRGGNYSDIYYAVFDGYGNVVKTITDLSDDGLTLGDWGPDAVQLSGGRIVVAWTTSDLRPRQRFAVIDANYNRVVSPVALDNPAAVTGGDYVSVTADANGRAVLTWMDYDSSYRRTLYYTLVNGSGAVLTAPMVMRSSRANDPYLVSSYEGYGNTSLSTPALEVPASD